MAINCSVCDNKRKIKFEDHIEDCPVCEEYVAWGEKDEHPLQVRGEHVKQKPVQDNRFYRDFVKKKNPRGRKRKKL